MKILGISGSLRAASLNSMLLRATARLAPATMQINLYPSLADIPLFNPDIEASDPLSVRKLREAIRDADALIIASPEYAHGITGAMKNALDWMVGTDVFVYKPVAIFNASPRSVHADAALREVFQAVVQLHLVVDDRIDGQRSTVRTEDQVANVVAGVLQCDSRRERIRGVQHFVCVDAGESHENLRL